MREPSRTYEMTGVYVTGAPVVPLHEKFCDDIGSENATIAGFGISPSDEKLHSGSAFFQDVASSSRQRGTDHTYPPKWCGIFAAPREKPCITFTSEMLVGSSTFRTELVIFSLLPMRSGVGIGVTTSTSGSNRNALLLYRVVRRFVSMPSMIYDSFLSLSLFDGARLEKWIETFAVSPISYPPRDGSDMSEDLRRGIELVTFRAVSGIISLYEYGLVISGMSFPTS